MVDDRTSLPADQLLPTGRSTFPGPTTLKTCFGDYASTEMRIGQLPAGHLGGSTLGVCGRQTCPVTCPMLSEMLSVSVGSRKPLGFPLPVVPFNPCDF